MLGASVRESQRAAIADHGLEIARSKSASAGLEQCGDGLTSHHKHPPAKSIHSAAALG